MSDEYKLQSEKVFLIFILGILSALRKDIITLNEAERLIFSPNFMKNLKKYGYNSNLIDVIYLGTELEDISNTQRDAEIQKMLNEIINILSELPEISPYLNRWYLDLFK